MSLRVRIISSMPPRNEISRAELFERLARGHAERLAVVTANARQAHELRAAFDRTQARSGLASWEAADVLPFGAFVQRLWSDALYSDLGRRLPILLSAAQEHALWEESIRGAPVEHAAFSAQGAAEQSAQAWRLLHAWRIDLRSAAPANEDSQAFAAWAASYERATQAGGHTDAARLPDVMAPLLPQPVLHKPAAIALHGFDTVTPQMGDFLDALHAQGCVALHVAAPRQAGRAVRIALTEVRDEIRAAARWARTRLEADPGARIGIVVPDISRLRARVERMFADVMRPDHAMAADAAVMPFNVASGRPLADYPLVLDALGILALAGPPVEFEDASRILRSPFLAHAESEMEPRSRLDARLRERAPPMVSLDALIAMASRASAPAAPRLLERLRELSAHRKADLFAPRTATAWAKSFLEALRIVGFPGERILDARERQTLERLHDLLAELGALDRVAGPMGFADALARLERLARAATFQPETPEVPIQVLGTPESAGIAFDHLWVMGMNDDAWPVPPQPNPFIPVPLQRSRGVPQADPAASLELDRRTTEGWCQLSGEAVFSYSRRRDEAELSPSPLVASLPEVTVEALGIARYDDLRAAIRAAAEVETVQDGLAPPPRLEGVSRGGTALFRDQAACPFRAVACHRLGSKPPEAPAHGLDPRARGSLVHAMLDTVWERLGDSGKLGALDDAALKALLDECAQATLARERGHRAEVLAGRFGDLERARLVRLALEWLQMERKRPPFKVVAREDKRAVTFGGVTVQAKLDRMDELASGGRAIIDYKTGQPRTGEWMGRRPDEPQLPMYARAAGDDVVAVAFGIVRAGQMSFKGIGRAEGLIPGVKPIEKDQGRLARLHPDWSHLVRSWSEQLEILGREFAAGEARTDPKSGTTTCSRCEQHVLCRIAEKAPYLSAKGGQADE